MPSDRNAHSKPEWSGEERGAKIAVALFPLLVLSGGAVASLTPGTFTGFFKMLNPLLMVILFGMGLTLTLPDFALAVCKPPPAPAECVILVGCAPGGISSNVMAYMDEGDMAFSVTTTLIWTLLASSSPRC